MQASSLSVPLSGLFPDREISYPRADPSFPHPKHIISLKIYFSQKLEKAGNHPDRTDSFEQGPIVSIHLKRHTTISTHCNPSHPGNGLGLPTKPHQSHTIRLQAQHQEKVQEMWFLALISKSMDCWSVDLSITDC